MEVIVPIKKPSVIDTLPNSLSVAEDQLNMLFDEKIFGISNFNDLVFGWCVDVLHIWADSTGLGYNPINILIFILLQSALILIFFTLWVLERNRKGGSHG